MRFHRRQRMAHLGSLTRRSGYALYGFAALTDRRIGQIIYDVYKLTGGLPLSERNANLISAFEREEVLITGGFND